MRIKIDNEEEFHVLEDICKRYRFNLLDDEVEEFERCQEKKQLVGIKRPFLSPPPSHFGHSSTYSLLPTNSSSIPTNSTAPPTTWPTTSAESPAKKQKRKMTKTTSQNPEVLDLELNI
uniref:Uncharacterized protein LOC114346891 n=1 Tax=Diabrotica virgifera virgifera TaxID=50390 RepID=A0A6P7H4H3_DIAVI